MREIPEIQFCSPGQDADVEVSCGVCGVSGLGRSSLSARSAWFALPRMSQSLRVHVAPLGNGP
eukprot:6589212-Lingulodinium_polyedra.AAC.1